MKELNKQAKLSAKVQQDLIGRSKQGLWGQPACMLLVLSTTDLTRRAPILVGASCLCLMLLIFARLAILPVLGAKTGRAARFWQNLHLGLLLTCAAVWGILQGVALWKFGYGDKDVLILLLYSAAVSFAMVTVLVHDRRLIATTMGLLIGPALLGSLLHGGHGRFDYLGAGMTYLLYCIFQGNKLNRMYESQLSDNFDLSVAAYQDCLTGLPNRLYMNEALEQCFDNAKNRRMKIALLYIDLDGFKQINDQHSHKVGDLFLCEAASRIRRGLRENDIAARIGGDEFTILLPECASEKEVMGVANRVLCDARLPVYINGHALSYSASIGVSIFPHTADNLEMLVRSADEAMYVAKTSGKDRICMLLHGDEKSLLISDKPSCTSLVLSQHESLQPPFALQASS